MAGVFEVPTWDELSQLPVEVSGGDEPWIFSVRAWADDGDDVVVTWDREAASATFRWQAGEMVRAALSWECLAKLVVSEERGKIEFRCELRSEDLRGEFVVLVGDRVSITDEILRA